MSKSKILAYIDLILICLLLIIFLISIFLPNLEILRVLLGIFIILIIPGYLLLVAIKPVEVELSNLEYLGISIFFSFSLSFLILSILNYIKSINLLGILLGFFIFFTITLAVSFKRRRFRNSLPWLNKKIREFTNENKKLDKILDNLIIISTLILVAFLLFYTTKQPNAETFTEFYIQDGIVTLENQQFPKFKNGSSINLTLGIINHEKSTIKYKLRILENYEVIDEFYTNPIEPGSKLEILYNMKFTDIGVDRRYSFNLYKEGNDTPIRELHFWASVIP